MTLLLMHLCPIETIQQYLSVLIAGPSNEEAPNLQHGTRVALNDFQGT